MNLRGLFSEISLWAYVCFVIAMYLAVFVFLIVSIGFATSIIE